MRKHLIAVLTASACGALFAPGVAGGQAPSMAGEAPDSNAVMTWNANAGEAAITACLAPTTNPLHESRMYAIMHIAIHDALNAIDRRFHPFAFDKRAGPGASPEAAVAAAARDVMVPLLGQLPRELVSQACIDAGIASVEAAYNAALAAVPNGPAKTQGAAVGQEAAAAILALRAADGAVGPFLNPNCPQDTPLGKYRCTPGFPVIAFESWEKVTPFVLQNITQFRPGPPYEVTEKGFAADFNEVKSLGGDGMDTPSARTPDQTEIALFWYESSPLKWSRIARTVSISRGLNLWENARLFGLLNMALADGYTAMVATKNHYGFWRPVTAIHNADADGNPDIKITRLVEEGNIVVAEGSVTAKLKPGGMLDAVFCDVFHFYNGKICKLTTYLMFRKLESL
jgi:hypothetical protein